MFDSGRGRQMFSPLNWQSVSYAIVDDVFSQDVHLDEFVMAIGQRNTIFFRPNLKYAKFVGKLL